MGSVFQIIGESYFLQKRIFVQPCAMSSNISERLSDFWTIYGSQTRSPLIPRPFIVLGNGKKITSPEANKHLKWDRMTMKVIPDLAEHAFSDYRLPFRLRSNMIASLEHLYNVWIVNGNGESLNTSLTLNAEEFGRFVFRETICKLSSTVRRMHATVWNIARERRRS